MNNYSWLQQELHRFALSSQFMREVTFDVESSAISVNQVNENHVFISGLARSGTTILLTAIYESGEFSSLSYEDMPFVLAPNLWSKLSFSKRDVDSVERAHGDGIHVSVESPEAFEEVFWMTFNRPGEDAQEKFRKYLQLINKKNQKERYLSKNNQNIRRLELISNIFPDAKILIPFRDPLQHSYSLLSQHRLFLEYCKQDKFILNYLKWIGHKEFGPGYIPIHKKNLFFEDYLDINHWLEQWTLTYQHCFDTLQGKSNIYFICYEKLCSSKEYWEDIMCLLGIEKKYNYEFKESRKDILLSIDDFNRSKGLTLYKELSQLK